MMPPNESHRQFLAQERQRAISWAREVLADPGTIVLDTETTGLDRSAVIVDIGIVDVNGRPLIDTLVNPGCPIPPDATRIHRITDDMVATAPDWRQVCDEVAAALARASRVIIYNAGYDTRIIAQTCARSGVDPTTMLANRFECAMEAYAAFYGQWDDYHQSFTWQKLRGGDHRALGDCRATLALMRRMAETVDRPQECGGSPAVTGSG
jgi:DNA polymerase-3 subunit epsilon